MQAWAWRLVTGETLADKLASDGEGPVGVCPDRPGRPPELQPQPSERPPPRPTRLRDPEERARALHAFANHELQAIECMAAALLRLDAPHRLQVGLCTLIRDEQRHLQRYLDRLAHYGHTFGDWPVSDVFWRQTVHVTDVRDFLAIMGLTFEQANLDFARAYADGFRAVGDEDTAQVLETVLADEVTHVRHGVHWLKQLDGRALWEAWTERLQAPLTPARGRGPTMLREPRQRAGLDEAFLDRLEGTWQSKGRPAVVWAFDYWCEEDIAAGGAATPPRAVRELAQDLALLPVPLATRDDVVVTPRLPSLAWRRQLQAAGVAVPELLERPARWHKHALTQRKLGGLEPWGWSPTTRRWLAPLAPVPPASWDALSAKDRAVPVLAKVLEAMDDPRLGPADEVGVVCTSLRAVEAALTRWQGERVIKGRYGTSGRNQGRVRPTEAYNRRWLERLLERQGAVVVEPWLPNGADLSFQLHKDDDVRFVGWASPAIDAQGAYRGSQLGDIVRTLPPQGRRLLASEPAFTHRLIAAVCEAVAEALPDYVGPIGVDAMLVDRGERWTLRPVLELNLRWNMGRVACELSKRLAPGRSGRLELVPLESLDRTPPVMRLRDGRWDGGTVWLGDPEHARRVVPVVVV